MRLISLSHHVAKVSSLLVSAVILSLTILTGRDLLLLCIVGVLLEVLTLVIMGNFLSIVF